MIGSYPLVTRWQAHTNRAVKECVDVGGRCSDVTGFEDFEVAATNLNAAVINCFEDSGGGAGRDGGVHAKCMSVL